MSKKHPSKIRPWLVWGSAGLFTMYQFLLQGSPSVMIPDLIATFGIDAAEVGFITTCFFYSYIAMQIPSGILVDIFGPKIILIIGCIAASTACVAFSNSHLLWTAKGNRFIMGLMCAPGIVATLTLASRWFSAKKFALVVGFTETLAMLGAALGAILLAFTVHHYGWRSALFVCGMVGYAVAILMIIFVRNFPTSNRSVKDTLKNFSLKQEAFNLITVLKEPQSWIGGFYSGLSFSIIPAFFALWGIPFLMDKFQTSSTCAASMVSLGYIGAGVGGPLLGWLSSRIQKRKIIMNIGSFLSIFILIAIIYFELQRITMYVLTFTLGIMISSYVIPFAIIGEILPERVRGKAMGFTNCLTLSIGAPVLQPIIGKMIGSTNHPEQIAISNFTTALTSLPFVMAIAFILSFFIKETHCQTKSAL